MNKDYICTCKCIWCGKTIPEVSFNTKPHIIPKSLGGSEIGVDVCDDCNHYFGTAANGSPSIDLAFKEVFNAYKTFRNDLTPDTWKKYRSAFFSYHHRTGIIKTKHNFNVKQFTSQFKRGLFEIFLQAYHKKTLNGNDSIFDFVRDYARYGIGELKVYYAFNNILMSAQDDYYFPVNDKSVKDIYDYGVFRFWFMGHFFFLEINPIVFNLYGEHYLTTQAAKILVPVLGNERIFKLENVMDLDFFLQRFNPENY